MSAVSDAAIKQKEYCKIKRPEKEIIKARNVCMRNVIYVYQFYDILFTCDIKLSLIGFHM